MKIILRGKLFKKVHYLQNFNQDVNQKINEMQMSTSYDLPIKCLNEGLNETHQQQVQIVTSMGIVTIHNYLN